MSQKSCFSNILTTLRSLCTSFMYNSSSLCFCVSFSPRIALSLAAAVACNHRHVDTITGIQSKTQILLFAPLPIQLSEVLRQRRRLSSPFRLAVSLSMQLLPRCAPVEAEKKSIQLRTSLFNQRHLVPLPYSNSPILHEPIVIPFPI